jgi:uroporphyrinogen decarboxylase
MTHRERVLVAARRQRPDRTPADYKGEPEADVMMMRYFGVDSVDAIQDRLQTDVRRIFPRYVGPPDKDMGNGVIEDYWGIRSRRVATGHGTYDMYVETSLWKAQTLADLERHDWPSVDFFDYSGLAQECARYPEHAILFEGADLFTRPAILRGMDNLLLDMMLRPDMVHYLIERFTAFYCEELTRVLEVTRGRLDLFCEWSDFGTQENLLISREMWREFVEPYLKRLVDVCHSGDVLFMLHSDGAIRDLIPDLIDLGSDILDPIQTGAVGMEPERLKRDFGDRLSFHGAIDTQTTLPFGTPEEVEAEVRHRVRTLGQGGGYIIAPSHTIQPDTSVANVLAMYKMEAREIL